MILLLIYKLNIKINERKYPDKISVIKILGVLIDKQIFLFLLIIIIIEIE